MSSPATIPFPHQFRPLTASGIYRRAGLALAVVVSAAVARGGWPAAAVVVGALAGAMVGDLFAALLSHPVRFTALRGWRTTVIALIVAAATPAAAGPAGAAGAGFLALVVGVWLPGGPGRYWLHPALVGIALATIVLPGYAEPVTTLDTLAAMGDPGRLAEMLSGRIGRLGIFVPADAFASFLIVDIPPQAPLAAGLLLPTLLASLIVFGEDLVPPVLPLAYFVSWAIVTWGIGGLPATAWAGEPLSVAATSLMPLTLFFVLIEPGTRPLHFGGLAAFGVTAGTTAALLERSALPGAAPLIAVLVAGSLVPLFDWLHVRRRAR